MGDSHPHRRLRTAAERARGVLASAQGSPTEFLRTWDRAQKSLRLAIIQRWVDAPRNHASSASVCLWVGLAADRVRELILDVKVVFLVGVEAVHTCQAGKRAWIEEFELTHIDMNFQLHFETTERTLWPIHSRVAASLSLHHYPDQVP